MQHSSILAPRLQPRSTAQRRSARPGVQRSRPATCSALSGRRHRWSMERHGGPDRVSHAPNLTPRCAMMMTPSSSRRYHSAPVSSALSLVISQNPGFGGLFQGDENGMERIPHGAHGVHEPWLEAPAGTVSSDHDYTRRTLRRLYQCCARPLLC